MAATREVTGSQDNFEEVLWESFEEGTPEDFVTSRDVLSTLKGMDMSDVAIGRRMTKLGYSSKDKKVNKHTIKVYFGLKKKVAGF